MFPQFTNKHNIPPRVANWLSEVDYRNSARRKEYDVNVTDLTQPLQIKQLQLALLAKRNQTALQVPKELFRKSDTPSKDISSLLATTRGILQHQSVCGDREISLAAVVETKAGKIKFGGTYDLYDPETKTLIDYKFKSCFHLQNLTDTDIASYTIQLNCYKWLMQCQKEGLFQLKVFPEHLLIIGIATDWTHGKFVSGGAEPVVEIQIEPWSNETTENFIRTSIEKIFTQPQYCSDSERWITPRAFAVMKKGRKSAVKLFDSELQRDLFIANNPNKELYPENRKKRFRRCDHYCPVSQFCRQYAEDPGDENTEEE